MEEQITKKSLNENLDKTKQVTEQLKLKIESSEDIKNLIENDINKLRERVKNIQDSLIFFKEKIDLLPESTNEKSEQAKLDNINLQIVIMCETTEAKLKQYFNASFEYKKEILPLESADKNIDNKEVKEIIPLEGKDNSENDKEFQEINDTVLGPLEALSTKNKYQDDNRKTVSTPDKYYLNNLKNLNYKNLDLAISNPKYQYEIISHINFFLEQLKESQNYIQIKIARELSSILSRHKDELIPGKYLSPTIQDSILSNQEKKDIEEEDDEDEEENIEEKDLVRAVAIALISNREFSPDEKSLEDIILNNTNENDIMKVFSDKYEYKVPMAQNFISIIERNKNSQAYIALENLANKSFQENNFEDIHKFAICTKFAKEKLNNYLMEKYQVPISEFKDSWNFDKEQKHFNDIFENLKSMDKIEKEGPGNVKKLVENYGIREFHRYPSEILVKQLEEENINQPYGLIVYPREDHNDAFDTHFEVYEKLYKDTRGHYGLKIYEISNKRDFAKTLIKNEQKYATENKISFMILGGHGQTSGITIGPEYKKNENSNNIKNTGNTIDIDDLQGSGIKNVSRFFEKDPKIILVSCSTGAIGGIGQEISKEYGANVMAPEKTTNLRRIYTSYDNEGKIKFDVKFYDKVSKAYQAGKEVNRTIL